MSLLLIDIGTGTQDILVYTEGELVERCPKMILPSPTAVKAMEVERASAAGKAVFLEGKTMGGGPLVRAIRRHLRLGYAVYATPEAALTLHDSPERVREMGVEIVKKAPDADVVRVFTTDFMEDELKNAMKPFGIRIPEHRAFAVQDHGYSPEKSNRQFRFEHMSSRLEKGDWELSALVSDPPAPEMTRMHALREHAPGALVIDTGPAAVFGMLMDAMVKRMSEKGVTLVNAGNSHTLCFTLCGERIGGIFEHHTFALTQERLLHYINKLQDGKLTNEEIFADGGHGAVVHEGMETEGIAVTGPMRRILLPDAYHAAPFGDMMLTGCFGLIEVWRRLRGRVP